MICQRDNEILSCLSAVQSYKLLLMSNSLSFFFSESIYTEVEEATLYDKVLDICLKRNAVNSFSGNMPQPGVTEGLNDSLQSSTTKQRFGARTGALFH